MSEKIYACAGRDSLGTLVEGIRETRPGAVIVPVDDPIKMRITLLAEIPGQASAVVGPQDVGVDAVNLAAAIAADGHASHVELVCHAPSGSLRSRAARAGIDRVTDIPEAEALPPVVTADRAGSDAGERQPLGRAAGQGLAPGMAEGDVAGASAPDEPPERARIERAEDAGKVIVFASGRGGVGKSTVVAAAAQAASSWGLAVALLDLDLCSGNLFGYHGLPKAPDLGKVGPGMGEEDIVSLGAHVGEGVSLWGPCARPEQAEVVYGHVGDIVSALANAYDVVLVDTSTTWTDAVAEAVQGADRLMLVADERAGAIGSLARMAALAVRLGVARTRIMRIMNRCDARRRDEGFMFRADMGLETARSFRILDGGDEVAELLSSGSASELEETSGDFFPSAASCMAKILSELGALPDEKAAKKALDWRERRHGLFSRMREAS